MFLPSIFQIFKFPRAFHFLFVMVNIKAKTFYMHYMYNQRMVKSFHEYKNNIKHMDRK